MANPNRISPTAHYTGWVWYRHGLSPRALATVQGRLFFAAGQPVNRLADRLLGGLTLERMLLQRHHLLDHRLDAAIAAGARQVVELGCGLSGRGVRMLARHGLGELRYVEADLPAMAARKRRRLERAGLLSERHVVVGVDVLTPDGPLSLEALADRHLAGQGPTVVITEGLVDYFAPHVVARLWERLAALLVAAGGGHYLSDLHLAEDTPRSVLSRAFLGLLSRATGGRVDDNFATAGEATAALLEAGFATAVLHDPADYYGTLPIPRMARRAVTRVVEAQVGSL
jgi:O-methyltransferase involved in polyketide biosynthesis